MTDPAAAENMDTTVPQPPTTPRKNSYSIRFDFVFKPGSKVPAVPQLHNQILQSWKKAYGDDIQFKANDEKVFNLESYPTDAAQFRSVFKAKSYDQRWSHVKFVHTVETKEKFHELKNVALSILKKNRIFLYIHSWDKEILDIESPGWVLHAHPYFTNRDKLKKEITEQINKSLNGKETTDVQSILARFEQDPSKPVEVPDFRLVKTRPTNTLESQRFSTEAIEIQCERPSIPFLKCLLSIAYEGQLQASPDAITFVPYSLTRDTSPQVYIEIIAKQNLFLEEHRNISIAGISSDAMHATIEHAGEVTSLYHIMLDNPKIRRIDLTTRTFDLGKWNISTHKDNFLALQIWIDSTVIPDLYELVPDAQKVQQFTDFPHPRRLGRKPSPELDLYAQSFSTAQSAANTPNQSQAPIRRTWGNTVANFEFQFDESFPPLESKTAKTGTEGETRSTASSTKFTLTDDVIRQAIAENKQDLRTEMKALAENIRQSLRTEISNMLKTELSQLVKMISKDLTAAVIASVRSELATTVRAVVQEITPSSPTPASPFHKRSKPDSDLDLDDVTTNLDTQLSYQPIQSQPPEDTSMSILR
jgi:hypothetical protein